MMAAKHVLVVVLLAVLLLNAVVDGKTQWKKRRTVNMRVTDDDYMNQLSVLGDGVGFYHDGDYDKEAVLGLTYHRGLVYDVDCSTDPDLCFDYAVKKADRPAVLVHKDRKVVAKRSVEDVSTEEIIAWASDALSGKVMPLNPDWEDEDLDRINFGFVFVDFYAHWCGHCKSLSPVLYDLAELMDGSEVVVAKVECPDNLNFCKAKGISGYPTLQLFLHGELIDSYAGERVPEVMKQWLDETTANHLAKGL